MTPNAQRLDFVFNFMAIRQCSKGSAWKRHRYPMRSERPHKDLPLPSRIPRFQWRGVWRRAKNLKSGLRTYLVIKNRMIAEWTSWGRSCLPRPQDSAVLHQEAVAWGCLEWPILQPPQCPGGPSDQVQPDHAPLKFVRYSSGFRLQEW